MIGAALSPGCSTTFIRAGRSIWDEITEEPFALPANKPLTAAAYYAGHRKRHI
jgi:hypothetical protein